MDGNPFSNISSSALVVFESYESLKGEMKMNTIGYPQVAPLPKLRAFF